MKFILGIKQNMTQVFDDEGNVEPVTVVSTMPNVVTQVKTKEKDGYKAVQIGFVPQKERRLTKAQKGHFKASVNATGAAENGATENNPAGFKFVKEFRIKEGSKADKENDSKNLGEKIDLSSFKRGDVIRVSAISKGKGFQGVVKRHGFHGGPRSHGQKHSEREPGSISGGLRTSLRHGMRMAGRMGGDRVTVKNLKIVQVQPEAGLILISGAVPGRRGTLVEISG